MRRACSISSSPTILIPALLTNIGMPARSQIPMKSVLFSTSVTSRCCSASARLRSVISRTILDAPTHCAFGVLDGRDRQRYRRYARPSDR